MANEIKRILDPRLLSASYEQQPATMPTPLTDAFYVNPENIEDDQFRTMYDPADSTPAPGNLPDAEAHLITIGAAQERHFSMLCTFSKIRFDGSVFRALREPDSYTLQNMGRTEVNRIAAKFANRGRLFKEVAISKILTTGLLYMNPAGQILESSSGASISASFDVAAGHKGNLGGLITGLFSVPGTDIPSIIESIDDAAAQAHVPAPTDVWVNKLNLQYLRSNHSFQFWAQHNPQAQQQVLDGGVLQGLWGKTWHFVSGYYTNASGTQSALIPTTGQGSLVLTPPANQPWLKCTRGATVLPESIDIQGDIMAALSKLKIAYGPFMYAKVKDEPALSLWGYMGDKFGVNFNEPDAIWMGTGF